MRAMLTLSPTADPMPPRAQPVSTEHGGEVTVASDVSVQDEVTAEQPTPDEKETPTGRLRPSASTRRVIWWPLIVSSVFATAAAYVLPRELAALAVGTTLLMCSSVTVRRFERHRRQAAAHLRLLTSSPLSLRRSNCFDDLINAAEEQMTLLQSAASDAESRSAQAEARIHLARRDVSRLQTAMASLPTPTILLDTEGCVFAANAAAGEALPEARPGEQLPSDGPVAVLTEAIRQVRVRSDQSETLTRDISLPPIPRGPAIDDAPYDDSPPPVRTYHATICPLRSSGTGGATARFAGIAVSLIETTDRDEIRQQCAQFLGAACHELKTPMASIQAHVELLADDEHDTPEERAESLGFINEQTDRLGRLVENMLNLSRIQSGLVTVTRTDESLTDVLTKPLELLTSHAAAKGQTLVNELSDLYMAVHLDSDLFQQAVTNLLSNAIKYTPEGGTVTLRSRLDDRHAIVEVEDTGLGIPEESLSRIFEQFYRVPENNHLARGTGLGLALVQFIAEDIHGGEISVRSEVGTGSTFAIRIALGHRGIGQRTPTPHTSRAD